MIQDNEQGAVLEYPAFKPMVVYGTTISTNDICWIVDGLANTPTRFSMRNFMALFPKAVKHDRVVWGRAADRLLQRWRRMGLIEFSAGSWRITSGRWSQLYTQAVEISTADAPEPIHSGEQ